MVRKSLGAQQAEVHEQYRRELDSLFERLRGEGVVERFHRLGNNRQDRIQLRYKVFWLDTHAILFSFFLSITAECVVKIRESSGYVEIRIPTRSVRISIPRIEKIARSQIKRRKRGRKKEDRALRIALTLKGTVGIFDSYRATDNQDGREGKDMFVVVHGEESQWEWTPVPINVKSALRDQTRHKRLFPAVPSLVVRDEEADSKVKRKILAIVKAFLRGEICHV